MRVGAYVRALLGVPVAGLVVVGLINYIVDPLQYFRRATFYPAHYSQNERYQNPGLARNEDYDTIVLGTSHSENFIPDDVDRILGGHTLNLSIAGSAIREQRLTLDLVLARRKVRRVLWQIDYNSFTVAPEQAMRAFPYYLYGSAAAAPGPYLLSLGTLRMSWEALTAPPGVPLSRLNAWWDRYPYGAGRVLGEWELIRERWNPVLRDYWRRHRAPPARVLEMLDSDVVGPIFRHPDVQFDIVLVPHSILDQASDFLLEDSRFFERLHFDNEIRRRLAGAPNARVWNFRGDLAISADFDKFKDMSHFGRDVNLWMLERIARRDYAPAGDEAVIGALAVFLARVCADNGALRESMCVPSIACANDRLQAWIAAPPPLRATIEGQSCDSKPHARGSDGRMAAGPMSR